jgi:hypothetical protein
VLSLTKYVSGDILGDFFSNSSGHPDDTFYFFADIQTIDRQNVEIQIANKKMDKLSNQTYPNDNGYVMPTSACLVRLIL